jgi:hypothetical protein
MSSVNGRGRGSTLNVSSVNGFANHKDPEHKMDLRVVVSAHATKGLADSHVAESRVVEEPAQSDGWYSEETKYLRQHLDWC